MFKKTSVDQYPKLFPETEEGISTVIETIVDAYNSQINYMYGGANVENPDAFYLSGGRHAEMHLSLISLDNVGSQPLLFFAVKSSKDHNTILFHDLRKPTQNYQFNQQSGPASELKFILQNNWINGLKSQDLTFLRESIITTFVSKSNPIDTEIDSLQRIGKTWAENEYKAVQKQLDTETGFPLTFSQQRFYVDKYNFPEIASSVNNEEFHYELSESLWAYENAHWFLCAAGLGTTLETLIQIAVNKHPELFPKNFSKAPTAKDYWPLLKKPPFNMSEKQKRLYDAAFNIRNSVDHATTGRTSKEVCDYLMTSIRTFYNDYYLKA